MTPDEQMQAWLRGESIHCGDKTKGECCPDFSCCKPEMLAPVEERQEFVSDPESRDRLCMTFLGRLLAREFQGEDVHIAGREP